MTTQLSYDTSSSLQSTWSHEYKGLTRQGACNLTLSNPASSCLLKRRSTPNVMWYVRKAIVLRRYMRNFQTDDPRLFPRGRARARARARTGKQPSPTTTKARLTGVPNWSASLALPQHFPGCFNYSFSTSVRTRNICCVQGSYHLLGPATSITHTARRKSTDWSW